MHLVHVKGADHLDYLLRHGLRQGLGMKDDMDAVAEHQQRRQSADAFCGGQLEFCLGVDLAECDVRVPQADTLEDRSETAAVRAPVGPEIHQHNAVAGDSVLKGLLVKVTVDMFAPPLFWIPWAKPSIPPGVCLQYDVTIPGRGAVRLSQLAPGGNGRSRLVEGWLLPPEGVDRRGW